MREEYGNIWDMDGNAICITTNGFVKKNGELVMGRGIAKQASERWPWLPNTLGQLVVKHGNHVHVVEGISHELETIFTFPVKHNWFEIADIELIKRSSDELMNWVELLNYDEVLLPRPGCGNGKLDWEDVESEIEPILDDRIVVVTF